MAQATVHIDSKSRTDRWQWVCPAGHRNWTPTNGGVWCQSCQRDHEIDDPHWHELRRAGTDETVAWRDVVFE